MQNRSSGDFISMRGHTFSIVSFFFLGGGTISFAYYFLWFLVFREKDEINFIQRRLRKFGVLIRKPSNRGNTDIFEEIVIIQR